LPRDKGTADICADNEKICPSVDVDPRKRHFLFFFFEYYSRSEKKGLIALQKLVCYSMYPACAQARNTEQLQKRNESAAEPQNRLYT